MTHDDLPEQLPPGPWKWEQVTPAPHPVALEEPGPTGWGIVAGDGTWVLTVDSGHGSPDVYPWEFGVDPASAVARALAMVPDLVAEHEDLWIALDEYVDVVRRHLGEVELPLPETARDLVRVLGDLCDRLAGEGRPTAPAGGSVEERPETGASVSDGWVDDYGTDATRPDLEAMYDRAPEDWRHVLSWAFALEGRIHELELVLGQQLAPTAGEVLDAARAGDEEAQRIVEAARAEGAARVAERVEELRRRLWSADAQRVFGDLDRFSERSETDGGTGEWWDLLRRVRDALLAGRDLSHGDVSLLLRAAWDWRERLDDVHQAAAARLSAREASWLDMLDGYSAELGLGDDATVAELRRRLRERRSPDA